MPSHRVIPSLLLKGSRLVKGASFAGHRDAGNPATTVRALNAQNADEILLLDIEASRFGRPPDFGTIDAVARECHIPMTVGGNVLTVADAKQCLRHGADKVFVNTTALDRPALINEIAAGFGAQAVVLGIDVVAEGGQWHLYDYRQAAVANRDWQSWLIEAVERGAGEVRIMSVTREGQRAGIDIDLHSEAAALVSVPIIMEGGAGALADLEIALRGGVESLAMGTMLVFSDNNIIQIKRHLKNAGFAIRL